MIERHRLQGAAAGHAGLRIAVVALRAMRGIERGAVLLRQRRRTEPNQQRGQGGT